MHMLITSYVLLSTYLVISMHIQITIIIIIIYAYKKKFPTSELHVHTSPVVSTAGKMVNIGS